MSIEFLITTFVVVLLPGTGVIYTLAVGLGRGFGPSVAAAFGCTLGIIPAALASIVGLAALFHTSAVALQIVKFIGAGYLLYMAFAILRDGGVLDVKADQSAKSHYNTAITGALLNILNPKLSLFFLAFLPQFVDANAINTTAEMLLLAGVFMLVTFIIFVLYGAFAALARDFVITRPKVMAWIKRLFAGIFGFLSLRLAFSDR